MDNMPPQHLRPPQQYGALHNGQGGEWYSTLGTSLDEMRPPGGAPNLNFNHQPSLAGGHHGNTTLLMQIYGNMVPAEGYFQGFNGLPYHPNESSQNTKRRGRPPKIRRGEPSQKRQKTAAQVTHNPRNSASIPGIEGCSSTTGSPSECCSSCSGGMPCADPHCAVPCAETSCEKPICDEPCPIFTDLQGQQVSLNQGVVPSSTRISNWNSDPWNPVGSRSSPPIDGAILASMIDPALAGNDGNVNFSLEPLPSTPQTPSMAQNMPTPFSPQASLHTPRYTGQPHQFAFPNESNAVLSGAGTMFNPSLDDWGAQNFSNSDAGNASMFNCPWNGCAELIPSDQSWIQHLHQSHVDPQMTFGCPLQSDSCPQTIASNPLDHLQAEHGFNFNMNDSIYSCPAPTCAPGEMYYDPTMFHNHFDQAHATPALGSLQCRLNSCDDKFPDHNQLLSHINEYHQMPTPAINKDAKSTANQPETAKYPSVIPDGELPGDLAVHSCKWKNGVGSVCGVTCASEKALQLHIRTAHLLELSKSSGYLCQWTGCNRPTKMGDKQGFSQRGKLERHMASHTGYKCAPCDLCDMVFSAEQAMKQHRLLHTGERPWKCAHCPKTFPQQSACTIHERTHTGEKPLECEICGKKFSESSNFSKHRKTHGEKGQHACKFHGCTKTFHRHDQLKKHMNVHKKRGTAEPLPSSSDASNTDTQEGSEAVMTPSEDNSP